MQWVTPCDCISLFLVSFGGLGDGIKVSNLWRCVILTIFWVVGMERNSRIFEGKEEENELLWDTGIG